MNVDFCVVLENIVFKLKFEIFIMGIIFCLVKKIFFVGGDLDELI